MSNQNYSIGNDKVKIQVSRKDWELLLAQAAVYSPEYTFFPYVNLNYDEELTLALHNAFKALKDQRFPNENPNLNKLIALTSTGSISIEAS